PDDRVRTFVHTDRGRLPFQEYLVRRRARGRVTRIEVAGARRARPAPGVLAALAASDALVIAPSNPLVSIGPILAVPGIRRALARRQAPAAAVSPLVGGRAVRGPLHRMLRGLGLEASPTGIARLYQGLVDLPVLDPADRAWDARAVEVVLREAKRIVRMDRGHVICETPHGWVCANAGVDESNGVAEGVLTLLPRDADASAAALCERLRQRFGVELAVVVTDTF